MIRPCSSCNRTDTVRGARISGFSERPWIIRCAHCAGIARGESILEAVEFWNAMSSKPVAQEPLRRVGNGFVWEDRSNHPDDLGVAGSRQPN